MLKQKLGYIRKAIEEGASYRVFQNRIEQLENDRDRLNVLENESRRKVRDSVSIETTEEIINKFMNNFTERIALLTISEKSELIRKCVDHIEYERDKCK